jgi:type II secretory pathway pseudopilin PulG
MFSRLTNYQSQSRNRLSKSGRFPTRQHSQARGMTLIEVTLVIAVLLGLISVLMIGATAFKKGSNRALCIQNLATVQKSMRSYSNLHAKGPGDVVTDLKVQFIGPGKFIGNVTPCPGSGTYSFGGDTISLAGDLYMTCSIADHVPKNATGW